MIVKQRGTFFQRSTSSTFWRRGRRRPQRSEVEVIEADAPGKRLRKKHCRNVHRNELCHHRGRKTAYIDFKNWFLGRINMDGKVIYVCIYIYGYTCTHTHIYIMHVYREFIQFISCLSRIHLHACLQTYRYRDQLPYWFMPICVVQWCFRQQESTTVASQVLVGRGMTIPEGNI